MTTIMRMLWAFFAFPFIWGIVNTPVTIVRQRFDVVGNKRRMLAKVSIPGALANALVVPFHKVDYIAAESTTAEFVGASVSSNVQGGTAQLQVNLQVAATPDNNIIVEVIGL